MENKKKLIAILIILAFLVGVLGSSFAYQAFEKGLIIISSNIFLWILLFVSVVIVIKKKTKSKKLMKIGLILLIIGGVFASLKIITISEPILRSGFVFWILGWILNLLEKEND